MASSMGASPPTTRQRAVSVGKTGPRHLVSKTSQLPSVNARRLIKTKPSVPTSDANRGFQITTTLQLPSVNALWLTKTNALGRVVARVVVGY